jgi:uncharacterized protein (TIGR01244 family)
MSGRKVTNRMERGVSTLCSVFVCIVALAGCHTPTLNEVRLGKPTPVGDWKGFDDIYRDGPFYFAGQPTAEALAEAPERGVKTVINLRADEEMRSKVDFDEPGVVRGLGMRYISLPVTSETFDVEKADRLFELLETAEGPVLLHCGSSNRTGGLWSMYLNHHRGRPVEEAIRTGRQAGLRHDLLAEKVRDSAR